MKTEPPAAVVLDSLARMDAVMLDLEGEIVRRLDGPKHAHLAALARCQEASDQARERLAEVDAIPKDHGGTAQAIGDAYVRALDEVFARFDECSKIVPLIRSATAGPAAG